MNEEEQQELRGRFEAAGQGHVFAYLDQGILSTDEEASVWKQLSGICIEQIGPLVQQALLSTTPEQEDSSTATSKIQAFDASRIGRVAEDADLAAQYRATGLQACRSNQIAALVLAGGQGTRLGYAGPKGMYNIGLPSNRTLFQLIAERILRLQQLAAEDDNNTEVVIPFFIMTSPLNHDETSSYFAHHDYFGLSKDNVFFFQQGMLPCLTVEDHKLILESPSTIAMAPDGNGGIYPALEQSGALAQMKLRGVRYIHVFSIDNALVKPADPVFCGYCIQQGADCGNKSVWKADAHEQVGVVAVKEVVGGGPPAPCVVEYSEISKEMAEQTDDQSRLVFGAANICNHFFTVDFVQNTVLPSMKTLYHVAHKKIPYYDEAQRAMVTPTTANNGIKLESFIFDVFVLSKNMAVLDCQREEEFAPVKNKSGKDSPATAREYLSKQACRWVQAAGARLLRYDNNNNDVKDENEIISEVSPLTSYAGERLEMLVQGKTLTCPFIL